MFCRFNLRASFFAFFLLVILLFPISYSFAESNDISEISNLVYYSLNSSLSICFFENREEAALLEDELGIILTVTEADKGYQALVLICKATVDSKIEGLFSKKSKFGTCLSEQYVVHIKKYLSLNPGIRLRTSFKHINEVINKGDIDIFEKKGLDGKVVEIRRGFLFRAQNVTEKCENIDNSNKENLNVIENIKKVATDIYAHSSSATLDESQDGKPEVDQGDKMFGELCKELSPEEFVDAVRFQNTFFLPDVVYLKLSVLLRRVIKRMELSRSAEETLSIILPGVGGLVVSDSRCEEAIRTSLVSGELITPGIGSNEIPILCKKLQVCMTEQIFHESVLVAITKSKRYVEFVLKRNRSYMWEILSKMSGVLGNINGLRAYQLWMELEILIKQLNPEEDVLHSDLPKEMILLTELINDSKSPTVECTISLMKIGTSYEIRLSQVSEVARICNRIVSDSSSFLSSDELRLISDTTILSRISDWIIGTFILEKHIPPGVTKPAACMYLSAITSPMDYSTITNFLWPKVVFAIASSSSSALSFTTKSVDPENCRKALEKIIKKIGDKLQLNIDETCGKMATCILNGRLGRINIDDTINNALSQSTQVLFGDPGTNSASLRVARFIFESKAPSKSKKRGFSKLSAPLRGSVLFAHLHAIMPGGFSVNDIVKFVHSFTKESPPYGPVKKCFKSLLKYIPVFVAADKDVKSICIDAFGPWIMPDVLVSDVLLSHNSVENDYII
ncbi:hypothetical protein FG386_000028 [Cryptosporidium ryanae]|uniref:uncharacterized protein n=1 Tax=Cryptosporidium ryanae TaxID=515981 RepID=UPI003519DA24|nr:hypothetical protein FG386_000028 [Cryptosporidium ryanae]